MNPVMTPLEETLTAKLATLQTYSDRQPHLTDDQLSALCHSCFYAKLLLSSPTAEIQPQAASGIAKLLECEMTRATLNATTPLNGGAPSEPQ